MTEKSSHDLSGNRCPICQGASEPAYATAQYRMYRCKQCYTAFVDPMPSPQVLREFYSLFHRSDDEGGLYDPAESRMLAGFPAKVELVLKTLGGRSGRLLDVGCGKGFFVKACIEKGINAEGIDLSDSGVAYATGTLGVPTMCGELCDLKDRLGLFDVVTFWATLEHLPDPQRMLRNIHGVLTSGGYLLLVTCAGFDMVERLLPGVTQWYDPPQHLVIFSQQGIRLSLKFSGFTVERIDTYYDYSVLRRLARMSRNVACAAALRTVAILARLQVRTSFQMTRFPLGNDMLVIARKVA